jgi:ribonuclease R
MKEKNREFLEKLEEEGKVIKVKGEKYSIPEKFGYILGKLDIVENRFGFVDTAEEGIFIPKNKFRDAVSGDTVFITITKKGEKIICE